MKKRKAIISVILICIIALILCKELFKEKYKETNIRFVIDEEQICLWKSDSGYYLFLPSYADISKVTLKQGSDRLDFPNLQRKLIENDSLKEFPIGETLDCVNLRNNETFSLTIVQSQNLPTIYINTKSGTMDNVHADKEYKEKGKIDIVDTKGTVLYDNNFNYIKGRGNVSWEAYEKKPYTFELEDEESLFGMSKGTSWVLVSNAADTTLVRNDLAYQLADALDMKYMERGQFVDLYLNGRYTGNYYLCPKIEISSSRLNIHDLEAENNQLNNEKRLKDYKEYKIVNKKARLLEKNPDDITGGYLIERDFPQRFLEEYEKTPSSFTTFARENYIVHSPKYCSKEQIIYISSFIQEMEDAILAEDGYNHNTGKKYTEYIDLNSFVKKYLLEEVSKNYDGGVTSSFFYKDRDDVNELLFAGPGWDYDMSFGNAADWMEASAGKPNGISRLAEHTDMTYWAEALSKQEDFDSLTRKYYKSDISFFMQRLIDEEIDKIWNEIHASAQMDYIRWRDKQDEGELDNELDKLKNFVKQRKDFLDQVWINGEKYYRVKLLIDKKEVYDVIYVKAGEQIGNLPIEVSEAWILDQWKDINTEQIVTSEEEINSDRVLYSQYIEKEQK